jgi:hypothetical protein
VYAALALMLIALAGLSAGVLRVGGRGSRLERPHVSDQLKSFLLVGAVALVLWSVVVLVTGLLDDGSALAETLAMLGFFTYALYLGAAVLVLGLSRRR